MGRLQRKMTFYYTTTGFGDIVLDLIGITSWIAVDPSLHVFFVMNNTRKPADRVYDLSLFSFDEKMITLMDSHLGNLKEGSGIKTIKGKPGCSLHPRNIAKITGKDVDTLIDIYRARSCKLLPSTLIANSIPRGISGAIGLHLRKSDKLEERDMWHGTTLEEFDNIVFMLKEYVKDEIAEGNTTFFVCSEDNAWKQQFTEWLTSIGGSLVEPQAIHVALASKRGWAPVLDFFALSRCRKIVQGIGYSTFSMAASLVGGGIPLVNLHMPAVDDPGYLLNWWTPVLNVQMANESEATTSRPMPPGSEVGATCFYLE